MRSIKVKFNNLNKEPFSSYSAFAKSVKGQGFSHDRISRNFKKLVDKNNYDSKDKKELIKQLHRLSNMSEAYEKEPKNQF